MRDGLTYRGACSRIAAGQAERKRRFTLRPEEPDMGNANEGSSMTQIDAARAGTITREMAIVAEKEGRDPEFLSLIHI